MTRIPGMPRLFWRISKRLLRRSYHCRQFYSSRRSSVSNAAAASASMSMTGSKTRRNTAKARDCPVARTPESAPLVIERSFPLLFLSFGMCVWDLYFSDRCVGFVANFLYALEERVRVTWLTR